MRRAPAVAVTWPQVLAWRVHQHALDQPAPAGSFLDVTERLGGLHAQVLSSAELALWARMRDLPPGAIQAALWRDRSLIKVWAMRGTLHLFSATDYPVWQAALSTSRAYQTMASSAYGVSPDDLERMIAAVAEVLDGQLLTRSELADRVAQRTGAPHLGAAIVNSSWGTLLKPATFRGYVCFGPNAGQNVRFTRPSSWLRTWRTIDAEDAFRQVVRRYLHAYGPATPMDFRLWWQAASLTQIKHAFADLADEAVEVSVEGKAGWLLRSDLADLQAAAPPRSVRLLPAFDQYVVAAARDSAAVLRPEVKSRVYRNQGWYTPVLLVDGRMLGVWRHDRVGSRLKVTIEAFEGLPAWVRSAAEAEAARLADFLGGGLELGWGPLPRGVARPAAEAGA